MWFFLLALGIQITQFLKKHNYPTFKLELCQLTVHLSVSQVKGRSYTSALSLEGCQIVFTSCLDAVFPTEWIFIATMQHNALKLNWIKACVCVCSPSVYSFQNYFTVHLWTPMMHRVMEGWMSKAPAEHFFGVCLCVYTHDMFDWVIHDDIIFPNWQPGAKRDYIAVTNRFWTLPCSKRKTRYIW